MNTALNLELVELCTGYSGRRESKLVSESLSLGIAPGEVVMLMGPNGSGKSTLMHTIAGLLKPLSGQVYISGTPLGGLKPSERAKLLSLVLTEKLAPSNMTVLDVVRLGRYPYTGITGRLMKQDDAVVEASVVACGLGSLVHRVFDTLSDGEKQRTLIARALAQETPLILLDEPTAHLDLPSRLEVVMMLRELAHSLGKSILISTHELDIALRWADTLWLMNRAGAVEAGCPEDLALSGAVERVFGSEFLSFDLERGDFILRQSILTPIRVEGQGLRYRWVLRALQRFGYRISPDALGYPAVVCTEEHYILLTDGEDTGTRLTTIGELGRAIDSL